MRRLATFCLAFALGVLAAQYFLPLWLLPYASAACALLGALLAWRLRDDHRRRALLIGLGLAIALLYDLGYVRLVQQPFEELSGSTEVLTLELADYPTASDYGARAEVRIPGRGLYGRAIYYADAAILDLAPGARVEATVEIRSAATIRDTSVTTFTSRGVFLLLYGRGPAHVTAGNEGSLRYVPQRLAKRAQEIIAASFPLRTRAFMNAILLGDRFELSDGDETCLREAGLMHVTAVSGLHCTFLLALMTFFIGKHRHRMLCAAAIPVLLLYALTAGLTPSVVRACIMMAFLLIGALFRRESDPWTALFFALFVILLFNPFAVQSLSLQLSFAAMAGLILISAPLLERIRTKKYSRAAYLALASLSGTVGALMFTIPLSALYFNSLVLIAPLSNLLCLWAASLTFVLGLATVLLGMVYLPAAHFLAYIPHGGAWYLLTAAKYLAQIPYHAVYFSNSFLLLWMAYVYTLVFACWRMKAVKWRWAVASALAVATLVLTVWVNTLPMHGGSLHVVALDVGQGQSVVLYSKGVSALIDCGSKSYLSAGGIAADYLQSAGIRTLDYVVLSHYHADHCNGLPVLFARLKVRQLIVPDIEADDALRAEVLALAEQYGVSVTFVYEPLRFPLGEASLTVFPPLVEGDMNEECLSALCSTGSFDALFTGDMDANTEYRLIATYRIPDVELFLAGHHGSKYSNGGDLLAEIKPETAIVSCGAGNSYGHPHVEALYRLVDAGAAVYRTDLQGTIHITVN